MKEQAQETRSRWLGYLSAVVTENSVPEPQDGEYMSPQLMVVLPPNTRGSMAKSRLAAMPISSRRL